MEERININVSATDYEKSSSGIRSILTRLEEMVHEDDSFVIHRFRICIWLAFLYCFGK